MMDRQVVILITGVNKGIGQELARRYLLRPNHTVIGSIRCDESSPEVADLKATQPAPGSQLHLVHIESTSASDPAGAVEAIKGLGIEYLDVVVANAGGGPFPVIPLDSACKPLLEKASSPKWISVSTGGGSISMIGAIRSYIGPAYGASKAALNWITSVFGFFFLPAISSRDSTASSMFTKRSHSLVQSGPGNAVAQMFGMEKAPHTIEHCVERMMNIIDKATRQETSGKFIRAIEGTEMDW
ncbi:hypothetical protein PG988_015847 [Apiospora saccharicola]